MRRRTLVAGGLGAALLAACESDGAEATGTLRIATGNPQAVYFKYGTAIAELAQRYLPNVTASVLTTHASKENVDFVLAGVADVGFTQADIAGERDKTAPGQLAALARMYDDYVHLVVAEKSGIVTFDGLRGKQVSVGPSGSGTAVTAGYILDVAGLTTAVNQQTLSLDDSVEELRQGTIDAFFFSGGLPVEAIATLAERFAIRLIDLDTLVLPLRAKYGAYYAERIVPASAYPGIVPTVAIGIANYLVVRASMAEPLAYGVTRLLFEGRDELAKAHQAAARLNLRSAISTPPLPLHPGAVRYYRAQKA